ncbi:hypothetical protein F-M6_0182 [Faustovirus]|nr:hypothetical protein F-LCD7_0181 [Faustovirus]QJX71945.1 hypothetical protein F-M6_0182 [Faustovirus]
MKCIGIFSLLVIVIILSLAASAAPDSIKPLFYILQLGALGYYISGYVVKCD